MNYLKEKYNKRKQFYRVISLALVVNMALIGVFAYIQFSVKDITVTLNGKSASCKTTKNSVGELLKEWEVSLDEKDVIEPGEKAKIRDGMRIDIKLFEVREETVSEETDFKTSTSYSSDLLEGESKVTREGIKGEDRVTYKIEYIGGEEINRKEIGRETIKKPVAKKISKGTAVAYNGVKYSRKLTVVSTAYTHTGNRTASGTYPHRGTMAVDRSVIPMGSYGYVPGYGEVHAEDTGGAIRGNRIDLFFETRGQAVGWGRRTVDIYIK